jgi:hypothetical protein
MEMVFGTSKRFVESASQALEGKIFAPKDNLCNYLEAAKNVSSCGYEDNTSWGKKVSNIED